MGAVLGRRHDTREEVIVEQAMRLEGLRSACKVVGKKNGKI